MFFGCDPLKIQWHKWPCVQNHFSHRVPVLACPEATRNGKLFREKIIWPDRILNQTKETGVVFLISKLYTESALQSSWGFGYFSSVGYVLTFIYSEDGVRGHPRLPDADKGGGNESQQMQEWQKSLNRHISRKFSSFFFLAPTFSDFQILNMCYIFEKHRSNIMSEHPRVIWSLKEFSIIPTHLHP